MGCALLVTELAIVSVYMCGGACYIPPPLPITGFVSFHAKTTVDCSPGSSEVGDDCRSLYGRGGARGAGTKFLITKFLITKFLMHKVPKNKVPNHKNS